MVLEALLSNFQNISDVGHGREVFNVMKKVGLSICIREFCVDLRFAECLASHLEEANKIIMLSSVIRDFDDLSEIGGILSLDI